MRALQEPSCVAVTAGPVVPAAPAAPVVPAAVKAGSTDVAHAGTAFAFGAAATAAAGTVSGAGAATAPAAAARGTVTAAGTAAAAAGTAVAAGAAAEWGLGWRGAALQTGRCSSRGGPGKPREVGSSHLPTHDSTAVRMKMAYLAAPVTPRAGVSSVYSRLGAMRST